MSYRYRDVESLNPLYDPNNGRSQQLKLTAGSNINNNHSWELNYRYEQDQRQDAQTLSSYRSFSPIRHGLLATWLYQRPQWRINMAAEVRDSQYQDGNRYMGGLLLKRDDQRYKASVQALWQVAQDWNVNVSYSYMDNQSNIEIYDYQQSLLKLGIGWEMR